jgi:hypothetical protein
MDAVGKAAGAVLQVVTIVAILIIPVFIKLWVAG